MLFPVATPFDLWRLDLNLCADAFRIGRLSEAGFRHHLARLGFAGHEIEAEVEWHRAKPKSERRAA
jgi:hypothetical protein